MSGKELDIDEDDVGYDDGPTEQAMPEYEDESSRLRHRQQSFQDELARTKAKLAEMPRGWESRGGGARDWDDSSEGLTPQRVPRRRTPGGFSRAAGRRRGAQVLGRRLPHDLRHRPHHLGARLRGG